MKTELDHLPPAKRLELERVVQILLEEFEEARALSTQDWKKKGRVLKIILYGSYARGGWVDEPHTAKGYRSDFDLLVVVNDKRLTDMVDLWSGAEEHLMRETRINPRRTPVNFIVHSLQEVNDGLAHGRYFFMDIAQDGIALYESDDRQLATPVPKTPEQALAMAKEYFEEWFPAAIDFKESADHLMAKESTKRGAFLLHQAAEQLYHCVLLVCTFYTPHMHNLAFLRSQAELIDRRLIDAWPRDSRRERATFAKLKEAYVKARYSKHYRITSEELSWLSAQVEALGRAVHVICSERVAQLEANAGKGPAPKVGQTF